MRYDSQAIRRSINIRCTLGRVTVTLRTDQQFFAGLFGQLADPRIRQRQVSDRSVRPRPPFCLPEVSWLTLGNFVKQTVWCPQRSLVIIPCSAESRGLAPNISCFPFNHCSTPIPQGSASSTEKNARDRTINGNTTRLTSASGTAGALSLNQRSPSQTTRGVTSDRREGSLGRASYRAG